MFVLDTDTLTHLLRGHKRVTEKRSQVTEEVAITVITRIEVLQGRFASVLKAEDGDKLLLAQQRLEENENDLAKFLILRVGVGTSAEFDRLRQNRRLRKIGRCHHPSKPSDPSDLQPGRLPQGPRLADRELG